VATIKQDRLELYVWIPLLAYTIRPGHVLRPAKEATEGSFLTHLRAGAFESVNGYFQLDARLAFVKRLFRQLGLRLDYHFIYYKFSRPQPVAVVSNQLNFAFTLSL
jgi:hypothetical protein